MTEPTHLYIVSLSVRDDFCYDDGEDFLIANKSRKRRKKHQLKKMGACPNIALTVTATDPTTEEMRMGTYVWKWAQRPIRKVLEAIGCIQEIPAEWLILDAKPFSRGGFGKIYKATTENGRFVAVKQMVRVGHPDDFASVYHELTMMAAFDHFNIIKIVAIVPQIDTPPWLVMEYMPNGNLYAFLKKSKELLIDEETKTRMSSDICRGMRYLHRIFCVHRDLTMKNILVDEDLTLKICDFGQTKFLDFHKADYRTVPSGSLQENEDSGRRRVYSLLFYAPEAFPVHSETIVTDYDGNKPITKKLDPEGKYSFKSDVWSFGVVLHQIWTDAKCSPYKYEEDLTVDEFKAFVIHKKKNPLDFVSLGSKTESSFVSLLKKMFEYNPDDRPTFEQIAPYFDTDLGNWPPEFYN